MRLVLAVLAGALLADATGCARTKAAPPAATAAKGESPRPPSKPTGNVDADLALFTEYAKQIQLCDTMEVLSLKTAPLGEPTSSETQALPPNDTTTIPSHYLGWTDPRSRVSLAISLLKTERGPVVTTVAVTYRTIVDSVPVFRSVYFASIYYEHRRKTPERFTACTGLPPSSRYEFRY